MKIVVYDDSRKGYELFRIEHRTGQAYESRYVGLRGQIL